jgi:hypothetical protein
LACAVHQEWCNQIETYLEAPRDGEVEQDEGPKGELDYWRNRCVGHDMPCHARPSDVLPSYLVRRWAECCAMWLSCCAACSG